MRKGGAVAARARPLTNQRSLDVLLVIATNGHRGLERPLARLPLSHRGGSKLLVERGVVAQGSLRQRLCQTPPIRRRGGESWDATLTAGHFHMDQLWLSYMIVQLCSHPGSRHPATDHHL